LKTTRSGLDHANRARAERSRRRQARSRRERTQTKPRQTPPRAPLGPPATSREHLGHSVPRVLGVDEQTVIPVTGCCCGQRRIMSPRAGCGAVRYTSCARGRITGATGS
jgi:hypothetical protein